MTTSLDRRTRGSVAAAALLGAAMLVAPALAFAAPQLIAQASAPATPSAESPSTAPSAAPAPSQAAPKASSHANRAVHRTSPSVVEKRIASMHKRLKITSSQETAWDAVAQAMRDDAQQMNTLIRARQAQVGSMNAVQDLQSYEKISEAHVDGLHKLVPAFETLYGQLSPEQQKTADTMFGRKMHRASSKTKGG